MPSMENQYERLEWLMSQAGVSRQDVADRISYEPQALSNWKRRGRIPDRPLHLLADLFHCNVKWLREGIPPVHNDPIAVDQDRLDGAGETHWLLHHREIASKNFRRHAKPIAAYEIKDVDTETGYNLGDDDVLIPVVEVALGAGCADAPQFVETKRKLSYNQHWLARRGLKAGECRVMSVRGDSMSPTLSDGDCVLIDTSDKTVIDGKIYAVRVGDDCKIKRLQRRFDGALVIKSDNRDRDMYPDEVVPASMMDQVYVIGKAVQRSGDLR